MSDALKVALLGCGVVGSEVVRLLDDQADDLAARIGAPLELAGIAVRRPARHTDVPADLLTTDAAALIAWDDASVRWVGVDRSAWFGSPCKVAASGRGRRGSTIVCAGRHGDYSTTDRCGICVCLGIA